MTFLNEPAPSDGQAKLYEEDLAQDGFVWNTSRLWGHQPALDERLSELIVAASEAAGLTKREKAMLVINQARTIGDSYCPVAWGRRLTEWEDSDTAAAALRQDETPFNKRERALANWARLVADNTNKATPEDIKALRDVGFDDPQILALTMYTSLRIALSTTNDALGARPDLALTDTLDPEVRAAITWGRAPA
jgi:alkylhydroperoxidase family enzyme